MAQPAYSKGSRVWVQHEGVWRPATVVAATAAKATLRLDSQQGEGAGPELVVATAELEPCNPALLDGVRDLTHLTHLNAPGILHVLRQRYARDTVYTTAGPVLVAVNPFKPLPLYGPDAARLYSQRSIGGGGGGADEGLEPHVFLTADRAFKQMVALQQSQSVLITGESGAGKTETTKIVMRYLAALAGGTGMEDRVLETNPILEAFGNAKTVHNNNSSRFGKLIEIYFNRGHHICGALIHTYLLEKSRVAHQQPGERSYHVFYQLCRGASEAERQRYRLPASLEEFAYLSSSGCTAIAGVDDAAEFRQVKAAMTAVGIGEEQQASLFAVLSAILWLGNVRFAPLHDDAVAVEEGSMGALRAAAALLGVGERALVAALTTRRMVAGGEHITRELNMEAALDARDALSKAVYAALFRWLVCSINEGLAVGRQGVKTTLSILDIYGFECFTENSFEQLCINFANERLQQQFSKHMFKLEQECYEAEGIDWAHVEFVDNQECVDLIEARPPAGVGIFSLLDEECMMPKGTDTTFAAKLQQHHGAHPRFSYNQKAPGNDFTVLHYAGPVAYTSAKFLDKNRDTLSRDLVVLLQASSAPLVQALAAEVELGQERRGSQTVGGRFRDQLRDLMQRLDATALHFVRCIKPNSQQEAGTFDERLVLHQLRCCGVLEVARIARAGYPTRYLHADFSARYGELLPGAGAGGPPEGASALDVCRRLLDSFQVDPSQYQIGRTRLFFRAGVLGQLEEAVARMQRAALAIQSAWRMARCRRAFLRARSAAVRIQAHWRGRRSRLAYAELLRRHRAAVRIQAAARGSAQRRRFRRAVQGVVAIQMAWRRHVVAQRVGARLAERRKAEESLRATADAKRRQQETFEAIQRDFGVSAGDIRRVLGLWQEHGDEFLQWRQQPGRQHTTAGSEVARAPTADDSGLLLEIAAAGVDAQQMQQRMEGLQSYCHKLERSVDDLREENQLLSRAVGTLQAALDGADPAAAAHCRAVLASAVSSDKAQRQPAGEAALGGGVSGGGKPPKPAQSHFSVHADARAGAGLGPRASAAGEEDEDEDGDTISLMSLNDGDESFTAEGQAPGGGGRTPTAAQLAAAKAESAGVVGILERELQKKASLFEDDAAFIREVRAGESEAPGMDPERELQRLEARYTEWKKQFKEKLQATKKVCKQLKREEKRVLGLGGSGSSWTQRRSPSPSVRGLAPALAPAGAGGPSHELSQDGDSSTPGRLSLFGRMKPPGRRG